MVIYLTSCHLGVGILVVEIVQRFFRSPNIGTWTEKATSGSVLQDNGNLVTTQSEGHVL